MKPESITNRADQKERQNHAPDIADPTRNHNATQNNDGDDFQLKPRRDIGTNIIDARSEKHRGNTRENPHSVHPNSHNPRYPKFTPSRVYPWPPLFREVPVPGEFGVGGPGSSSVPDCLPIRPPGVASAQPRAMRASAASFAPTAARTNDKNAGGNDYRDVATKNAHPGVGVGATVGGGETASATG